MKKTAFPLLLTVILLCGGWSLHAQDDPRSGQKKSGPEKLVVLWTSGEKDVFTKMIQPYLFNAKKQGWFKEVTLIIWGPSARLLAGDKELQSMVKSLKETGVVLEACVWCANQYGVAEDLKQMGVDVKGMGSPLTKYLKDKNTKVMDF